MKIRRALQLVWVRLPPPAPSFTGGSSIVAKLTTAARKKLPKSDFVEKGARKYPIPDAAHARDARARSSGKPEHASVVAAVKRKFPKIKITK
jgi:hypothetical protein